MLRLAIPLMLILILAACSGPGGAVESASVPATIPAGSAPTATASATVATDTAIPTMTATIVPSATPEVLATVPMTTVETRAPEPTEPEPTVTPQMTGDELIAEIDALVAGREGHYGVVVIGPGGEPHYTHDADRQVQSASLYKLLILVEVFHQFDTGTIAPDDPVYLREGYFKEAGFDDPFQTSDIGTTVTVDELLRPMVGLSSNVAAFALLDLVGNWNVNATAADLGMKDSEIRWMPDVDSGAHDSAPSSGMAAYASLLLQTPSPEEGTLPPTADEAFNVSSAADTALLFRLLVEGQVVSPEASETILDLLANQVVNDRLPALLPAGAVVAHKTGNIDNVIHDAGVIYTPSGPAVVVVLTENALEWEAVEFMQQLGLLVNDYGSR